MFRNNSVTSLRIRADVMKQRLVDAKIYLEEAKTAKNKQLLYDLALSLITDALEKNEKIEAGEAEIKAQEKQLEQEFWAMVHSKK